MDASKTPQLFLPVRWEGDAQGIVSVSWRDDPLHGQVVLTESDYRQCFPKNALPWPKLCEILLPDDASKEIEKSIALKEEGQTLRIVAQIHNSGSNPATLSFIRLALPMDQCFRGNDVFKYEQNVLRHAGLIGHGAYLYWRKPGGRPPLYLLVAQGDTAVNRFFVDTRYGEDSMCAAFEGVYALEMTDSAVTLAPGETLRYAFRLAIVEDESRLPEALEALGGLSVDVLPGMAVQRGETLRVRLATRRAIERVWFEGGDMSVVSLGHGLYESIGAGAGERSLHIAYADGGASRLKFFVIDPVQDIVRDFAAHVAEHQFETDPEDPCYHGILAWNMTDQCRVNSRHNPFDAWMAGGSDEIGLVSGLFLSEKNCYWPDEREIRVLGLHVKDFIENRLTEQPGNRVHRMVPWFEMFEPWAGNGADDVWRAFNYVHVANICYNMYRIAKAKQYPFLEKAEAYLRKACDYAVAMFSYWMFPNGEGATKYGNMGEMNMPLHFVPALREEGMNQEADWLEKLMLDKAAYFSTKQYPFGSEMAFDTTAYEAVYAYGKLIGDDRICSRAVSASLANRARTPLWHKYSVDVRAGGDSCWNVSYMTQLGAWPVMDSLLEGKLTDPEAALMAHAGTLGGFCMYNSGGCWDDAPINRHASQWVWNERMEQGNQPFAPEEKRMMTGEVGLGYFGALYATCAYLLTHPRLGHIALGCSAVEKDGATVIQPDPCFGMRLCDLERGYALKCVHCEIEQVVIHRNRVTVNVRALPARQDDLRLYVRGAAPGVWTEFHAEHAETHSFELTLDAP